LDREEAYGIFRRIWRRPGGGPGDAGSQFFTTVFIKGLTIKYLIVGSEEVVEVLNRLQTNPFLEILVNLSLMAPKRFSPVGTGS